ncbi:hypothetical protein [Mariniblastus fucicola]|uniref:Uncharacterized protein n=1 Tax=Mariniblastus fucicola TaxID=980251 RepID=A0A5B9PFS8_9BACT|nr:hypothetical protein [Mariniblastus fucicola]QEG24060.1 hypothetical protein MFFC18_39760 [Mariniblastus fucicola]
MASHVRLRAPQHHGQTLQLPPLADGPHILDSNRGRLADLPAELQDIRDVGRPELRALALQYSQAYLNVEPPVSDSIVMSGHQPTLFHPGVWFKNFALDAVAKSANATAINLVVDNDLCNSVAVMSPFLDDERQARLKRIAFDTGDVEKPFEMCQVRDDQMFSTFDQRLADSIRETVDVPIVKSLWPEVRAVAQELNAPASLAAGRHRLEQQHGLNTLELPVSVFSSGAAFAMFVERLVCDAERLVSIYNDSLHSYRVANRIRSRSHPVPELETDGSWSEIPFWIWTADAPNRRRLFCKCNQTQVQLSDREGWTIAFERSNFVASFQELNQLESKVFIRPRALATTMFSRLFCSDLFLHGIGGAKYDQLNDEIIKRFFNVEPPGFLTVTATMKLPFEFDAVTPQNVREIEVQLRRLRFHPEVHLPEHELSARKYTLVRNPPSSGSRKTWHDEIDAINLRLFDRLASKRKDLEAKLENAKRSLPTSKILGSREFSFTLFPESLIQELSRATSDSVSMS